MLATASSKIEAVIMRLRITGGQKYYVPLFIRLVLSVGVQFVFGIEAESSSHVSPSEGLEC